MAKKRALEDYKKWALLEKTSWKQKSKEIWLKEGDKNTRFFHKMAHARARRNLLTKVKIKGVTLTDENKIWAGVCRAYQSLLSESGNWRPSVRGLQFGVLGEEKSRKLRVAFYGK